MNILITGANGQLGREMRLVSQETDWHCLFTDVVEAEGVETTLLDITDLEAIRQVVKERRIECIVNCAAYTNVDKAESDEAFCRQLNADAPRNLALAMKEVGGLSNEAITYKDICIIRRMEKKSQVDKSWAG